MDLFKALLKLFGLDKKQDKTIIVKSIKADIQEIKQSAKAYIDTQEVQKQVIDKLDLQIDKLEVEVPVVEKPELYFETKDYLINPDEYVSADIEKKINYHNQIITAVQKELGEPIWVSKNSGYRSVNHELKKGRSGKSQHCFIGDGAADYACYKPHMARFLDLLRASEYKRVCHYPQNNFVHVDFKGDNDCYFTCTGKKWIYQG